MKKTIEVEVPEGYEITAYQTVVGKGDTISYINIDLKKVIIKDWNWYVENYFKRSDGNYKLANVLSNVSPTYLLTIKTLFLDKEFNNIWEYKIGLLKFICDDLGYSLPAVLSEINSVRSTYMKIHKICPVEFLDSIL